MDGLLKCYTLIGGGPGGINTQKGDKSIMGYGFCYHFCLVKHSILGFI